MVDRRNSRMPRRERGRWRQQILPASSETIHRATTQTTRRAVTNPTPTITPTTDNTSSLLVTATTHYRSVLGVYSSLVGNMWTSFNTQESRDGIEVITSDNNRDVQHQVDGLEESEGIIPTAPEWPTEDVVDETEDKHEMIEFGENALPNYNELEDN